MHHPEFGYSNCRFVISDLKNLGIPSCTKKYQVEINLGVKGLNENSFIQQGQI